MTGLIRGLLDTRRFSSVFLCQMPAELRTDYKEDKDGTVFCLISLSIPHVKTEDQGDIEECQLRLEGGRDEEQKIHKSRDERSYKARPQNVITRQCNVI
ncbi:hypothetical protein RvY_05034 [Ramazzottius varieornatus]|uniref:Uncharacterized protein n=1 Tax=Ramazzottius varieornatus TaxID=947166 RepID=A0A1D1UTN3_RAMVA|nr:hypothetical protein RvY_05034 [Ramazzottius varieornatus]